MFLLERNLLGTPSYDPCANFAGYTECIDASDLGVMATHLGHDANYPLFESGVGAETVASGTVALGRLEFTAPSSDVTLSDLPISYEDVAVDGISIASVSQLEGLTAASSQVAALNSCSPNPFNPRTTIRYTLDREGLARLVIYDVAGRRVRKLVDEIQPPGERTVVWDGRDDLGQGVGSGIYLYRLEAAGFVGARKLVVAR